MMKNMKSLKRIGNRNRIEILLFLFITFIVLVSCIDPASRQFLSVEKITVINGFPYLLVEEKMSWGPGCCDPAINHIYSGSIFADNWQLSNEENNEIVDKFNGERILPIVDCYPKNRSICYRITETGNIDYSEDGGESWNRDWKIPVGRERYMKGYIGITGSDYVEISTIPRDLAVINSGKSFIAIIPCGIQGLLIKRGNGDWERVAIRSEDEYVLSAEPLPYKAKNFSDLSYSVGWELQLSVYFVAILAIVLYFRGRKVVKTRISDQEEKYNSSLDFLLLITIGYSSIILVSAWLAFILWGFGFIPFYEVSVTLTLLALIFSVIAWRRRFDKRFSNKMDIEDGDA